jgi:SAM-dependent methyltransferase
LEAIGPRGGRILEVGCGVGRFIRTISHERPDLEPHGSDLGPRSIALAAEYRDGVAYTLGSGTALPYKSESFDAVVLFDVLEHIPGDGPAWAIAEARRVLKPGGVFHSLIPCEGQPGTLFWLLWKLHVAGDLKERHGDHVQRFTRRGIVGQIADAGFDIENVRYSMHPIGQVKDVLTYLAREGWFQGMRLDNKLYKTLMTLLWAGGYIESRLLSNQAKLAAVVHVDAIRK